MRRTADHDDIDSSGELRQNRRIQADRAAALDNDGIAQLDACLFNRMVGCGQTATGADKCFGFNRRWQLDDFDAGF